MKFNKTEKARSNQYVMWVHTTVVIFLIIAYFVDIVAGTRSLGYYLTVVVLASVPALAEHVFYKRNPDTTAVQHLVGYGFAVVYTFLLFTARSPLTFTYVLPMILAVSAFNNMAFSIKVNVGVILINIIQVYLGMKNHTSYYINASISLIQVIILIIIGVCSIILCRVLDTNNKQKLAVIEEEHDKAVVVHEATMEIAKQMTKDIELIYNMLQQLGTTAAYTRQAMEQVNEGSANTAQAVQSQLINTKTIQKLLGEVNSATEIISTEMESAKEGITTGHTNMGQLVSKVGESADVGSKVAVQLEDLDAKIKEMNSIIGIIDSITFQTNILALNAGIEAARAGEAGKGFAVVADEITSMAGQTKRATVNITHLVENVSTALSEVVEAIRGMITDINESQAITTSTEKSFYEISGSTEVMNSNIQNLTAILEQLVSANVEIVDSVHTVSDITEEVAVHADETYNAETKNVEVIQNITKLMQELRNLAARLDFEE